MFTRTGRGEVFQSDDPVVFIAELLLRTAWLVASLTVTVLLGIARHPLAALLAAGVWLVNRWAGSAITIWTCAVVVVGLLVWRLGWHHSFSRAVGDRSAASWRAVLYRFSWQHIAVRTGLLVQSSTGGAEHGPVGREVARLGKIRSSPGVDRLRVRLPTGLTTACVEKAADGLAHAFRVREVRVVPDRPGFVWVELHRRDVLAPVLHPLAVQDRVDLGGIPIGRHEDGTPWRFRLRGTHVLIAGATGAGKGSILWSLLRGLAARISDGSVQVWAIDPKGGMELGPGRALFTRFEDRNPEAMCQLIEDLVTVKDARAKELAIRGLRTHHACPESPHLLLVLDELATLTAFADRKVSNRIDQALGLLLTQGRACGISVVAAVQDPGKDVVGWRDLFPTRIALRLDNPIQVDMVLGDGARERGARADHISELTPGVGYVRVEGTRQLRRVRAAYLTDEDIIDLAASHRAPPAAVVADLEADMRGSDAA